MEDHLWLPRKLTAQCWCLEWQPLIRSSALVLSSPDAICILESILDGGWGGEALPRGAVGPAEHLISWQAAHMVLALCWLKMAQKENLSISLCGTHTVRSNIGILWEPINRTVAAGGRSTSFSQKVVHRTLIYPGDSEACTDRFVFSSLGL